MILYLFASRLRAAGLTPSDTIHAAWDQGSSSVVPSLPGFQNEFGLTSGANPKEISNFVSLVYIGAGVGGGLSFFTNDRLGRLWSLRLYVGIYTIGQLIAIFASGNLGALYSARIVSGLGVGALTVIGPVGIVEVAPTEIRGLLAVWFSVAMLLSLTVSCLAVLASFQHIAVGPLQYQVVFFVPVIVMALVVAASFFLHESPRWLFLTRQDERAVDTLVTLRGLPATHPRIAAELDEIQAQLAKQRQIKSGFIAAAKEAFLVPANLRRVQQAALSYALAQLSGANNVTSYLVPILGMVGLGGGTERSLFLTSMYGMAKFFFTLMASFFFIDALGRRGSLFMGITIQMISDIYIGVFIKYQQEGNVSTSASEAAIAMIFLHGFGFAVGKLPTWNPARSPTRVEVPTDVCLLRSPHSALRLWCRTLAHSDPILRRCVHSTFSLALLLRPQQGHALPPRKHQQLGHFPLLRRLVFRGTHLYLLCRSRDSWGGSREH